MPEKPGILFVCEARGGSGLEAHRVAAALQARGHRVGMLVRRSSGRAGDLTFALRVGYALWRQRQDFDLVCFFGGGPHLGIGLATAYSLRKAIAARFSVDGIFNTMSRTAVGQFELGWFRDWQVPLILPDPRMILQAEAAGFARAQLVDIPALVDTDTFRPPTPDEVAASRQKHGLPPGAKVVICTGRLAADKGLDDLIRGTAEAAEADPAVMLVLVGDGPARQDLETLARQFDPTGARYRFTGQVPPSEVPALLAASDVFARTSPTLNSPSSLLEAMATGLPSVVSSIDGHLQCVQNHVHGLTVSAGRAEAIGPALTTLLADPALRRSLAPRPASVSPRPGRWMWACRATRPFLPGPSPPAVKADSGIFLDSSVPLRGLTSYIVIYIRVLASFKNIQCQIIRYCPSHFTSHSIRLPPNM